MWNLLAQLKQEDVFKSISENVGNSNADPRGFYIFALVGAGLILVLVIINSVKKREATPRAVNHQGKLVKEMLRKVTLKGVELKHLRHAAADQGCDSPLTLVLCPSLLAKGIHAKTKADKRVLMGVAKKMGILKKK
jgi:hypothetical protein